MKDGWTRLIACALAAALLLLFGSRPAPADSAPAADAADYVWGFAGRWQSNWGELTFIVDGAQVTGHYTHDEGRIEATLSPDGRSMVGVWLESPTYRPPSDGGKVTFALSDDGNSISGQWGYGDNLDGGPWTGTRIGARPSRPAPLTVVIPADLVARPGGEVRAPIQLRSARGLGSFEMELAYDAAVLEAVAAEGGPGLRGVLVQFNVVRPGLLRLVMTAAEPIDGDGQLLVRFKVLKEGDSSLTPGKMKARAKVSGLDLGLRVTAEPGRLTAVAGPPSIVTWILVAAAAVVILLVVLVAAKRRGRHSHDIP